MVIPCSLFSIFCFSFSFKYANSFSLMAASKKLFNQYQTVSIKLILLSMDKKQGY